MPKLKVGVFMGGKSIEKEVSFNSGRTICDHLNTTRYDIIPIYQTQNGLLYLLPWQFLHRGKTTDFEHRLSTEASQVTWDDLPHLIDFMYIAMHGRFAEDGILQGALELLNIPYLGSSRLASALCMDKNKIKTLLSYHGIAVPHGISIRAKDALSCKNNINAILSRLHAQHILAPWIIKPHNEGSSVGISMVRDENDLANAIIKACTIYPHKPQMVLIEECVIGMEFSCITLFDYRTQKLMPLSPTEIVPDQEFDIFDYTQKYMPGRTTKYTPARCSAQTIRHIQETCMSIMRLLDIKTISRIDGFVTPDNRIVIVDPNTFSGMAPSSFAFREAAEINMSHTELINHLIETDLAAYGMLDKLEKQEKSESELMHSSKQTIAILMGGSSHEREISLESGRNIVYKLNPQKYRALPIFVNKKMQLFCINHAQLVRNSTEEIEQTLQPTQQITWHSLKNLAHFVFIGLHGGLGENGSVQGMLEMLDIPYNGSGVFASALCMNKYKTAQYIQALGFDTPIQIFIARHDWYANKNSSLEKIASLIKAPYIVKPYDDGCSVLIQKVQNEQELSCSIEHIFMQQKDGVLVEEWISGTELTVGIIGNEEPCVLPPSKAVSAGDLLSIEEKFLPGAGENQTPAPLPPATILWVQQIMRTIYSAIGIKGYARIDCFYQTSKQSPTGKERIVILEINTLPGLTPATCIFHQAAEIGLKPMDFIETIIEFGFENHQQNYSALLPPALVRAIPAAADQ